MTTRRQTLRTLLTLAEAPKGQARWVLSLRAESGCGLGPTRDAFGEAWPMTKHELRVLRAQIDGVLDGKPE